jgi:GT2 family glycosyltransferase
VNIINPKRIAAIITCYNRKQKTLDSLKALFDQNLPEDTSLSVYLVDDNSTDGTSEAIAQHYPQVTILNGDGSLFWNGGMRMAFAAAMLHNYDYYLWLNDDTTLYSGAILKLWQTSQHLIEQGQTQSIVIGSTQDPETGELTYGGLIKNSWWHPFATALVVPGKDPKPCDLMNGNCVLIPKSVVSLVGNLDSSFGHYLGDYDYGLRARKHSCTLWITPGYIGTCAGNLSSQKVSDHSLNQKLEQMEQPKGLAAGDAILYSFQEWRVYSKRHAGLLWVFYWLLPYRRLVWLSIRRKMQQFQRVTNPPI